MTSGETSPTARALRALDVVQRTPGITNELLAKRLGVTDRAARRYIAILRESGVQIESNRGPHGGYRIGRGLRLPPLVFTATEAVGLVMAALDSQHVSADSDDPVRAAIGKLIGALPSGVARPAATMRAHEVAVPSRSTARADPNRTSDLVAAAAAHRRVRVSYRSASGSEYETRIDPWSVVVRHGRWYVLCFAHDADAMRTLRIDRIASVTTLAETFRPPEDLDPVALLEQHLCTGWPYRVQVSFAAPLAEVQPHIAAPAGTLEAVDDTHCTLTGSTNNPSAYAAERLAPIPYPFTVHEGPELRDAVAKLAARLSAATS